MLEGNTARHVTFFLISCGGTLTGPYVTYTVHPQVVCLEGGEEVDDDLVESLVTLGA